MIRFYPALFFYRGPLRWEAELLDFDVQGHANTSANAAICAKAQLQERVNGMTDQEQAELPYPTHRLIVEHRLVAAEAHGWELIAVELRMKDEIEGLEDRSASAETKEKSNDSKRKGNKKKRRR